MLKNTGRPGTEANAGGLLSVNEIWNELAKGEPRGKIRFKPFPLIVTLEVGSDLSRN